VREEIGAAGKPRTPARREAGIAAHEVADVVAKGSVPFGPAAERRERADLVEAGRIPGLGDEGRVGDDRIVGDALEHGGLASTSPFWPRPRIEARSKRKPSTCISATQ
jgi:hypothetical protein